MSEEPRNELPADGHSANNRRERNARQDHRFLRRNRQRGRRRRARPQLRQRRRRGVARLTCATPTRPTSDAARPRRCSTAAPRCSAARRLEPRRHRPLHSRGPARAGRAERRRRDRVLLGLPHRQGPRHDRQLRPAPARGRPVAVAIAPVGLAEQSERERAADRRRRRGAATAARRRPPRRSPARSARRSCRSPTSETDLLVIDSRPEAAQGRVSISSSAAHLIEIATCPVLVLAAWRRAVLRQAGRPHRLSLDRLTNRSPARSREQVARERSGRSPAAPPAKWPTGPVHSQVSRRLTGGAVERGRAIGERHGIVAGVPARR